VGMVGADQSITGAVAQAAVVRSVTSFQVVKRTAISRRYSPIPRDCEPWPLITPEDNDWEHDQILDPTPPGPDPPPPPAPPHDPDKDPPPF